MNQIKIPAQNLPFFLLIAGFLFCLNLLLVNPTLAAWSEPDATCTPGDPGSCAISAPINVSDTAQTKLGNLNINGTLHASDLQGTTGIINTLTVSTALTVNAGLTLYPDAIIDSEVSNTLTSSIFAGFDSATEQVDLDKPGEVSGVLPVSNLDMTEIINQLILSGDFLPITGGTLTGTLNIETDNLPAAETHGIYVPDNSNYGAYLAGDLIGVQGYSAGTAVGEYGGQFTGGYAGVYGSGDTHGVYGYRNGSGSGIFGRNAGTGTGVYGYNTGTGYGTYGYSVTNYGVFGYSSTSTGVYGRTLNNVEYGVKGCYYSGGEQNCGQIGGLQYPGYFNATTASYGSKSCKNGSSCASLGGTDYAGYFEAPVNITTSTGYGLEVTDGSSTVTLAEDDWAGQFSDKVLVDEEVVARKFQPTSKTNSIVPFTAGQWVRDFNFKSGVEPAATVFDGEHLWVAYHTTNFPNLYKINPHDENETTNYSISVDIVDMIFDGRYIWFIETNDLYLHRLDIVDDSETDSFIESGIQFPFYPVEIVTDGQYTWTLGYDDSQNLDYIMAFDRALQPVGSIYLSDYRATDLIYDGEMLWTVNRYTNSLSKIDISTPSSPVEKQTCSDPDIVSPARAVFDGKYIWVTNRTRDTVVKLDTACNVLETISVGDQPVGIEYDGTYIWVVNRGDATLSMIKAGDATVEDTIAIEGAVTPTEIYFDGTYLNIIDTNPGLQKVIRVFSGTGYGP